MNLRKMLLGIAGLLLMTTMASGVCKAAEDEQDPLYYRYHHTEAEEELLEEEDESVGNTHTAVKSASQFSGYYESQGIDVSYYQGTIDWEKVAADQIEYAIIRVGYTRYSADYKANKSEQYKDVNAIKNLRNATAAGLPVGAYIFSQAITEAEAVKEADYAVSIVKKSGVSLELPIVFDYEYVGTDCRLYQANLTAAKKTKICQAFCEEIKAQGYTPMINVNYSMLTKDLKASSLDCSYLIWLAHYTTTSSYSRPYQYWQFCSTGGVSGISGYVDMDLHYIQPVENDTIEVPQTTATAKAYGVAGIKISWTPVTGVTGYYVERYNPDTGNFEQIATVKGSQTSVYKDTSLDCATDYIYRVRCYKIRNDQVGLSEYSDEITVKTKDPVNAITLTTSVPVYEQADTAGTVLATLGRKASVSLIGTFGSYYKVSFLQNEETVIGYIPKSLVTNESNLPTQVSIRLYPKAYNCIKIKWNASTSAQGYRVDRYDPALGKYVRIATITDPSVLYYSDSKLQASTEYQYRVFAFNTVNGYTLYSKVSEVKSAATPAMPKAKTISQVNLRKGPGTSYRILGTIKSNKILQFLGTSGKWYKVKVTLNGVRRTGYVLKKYVTLM